MISRDRDRGVLVVNVPLRLLSSLLMAVPLAVLGDASLNISPTSVHPGTKGVQFSGQGFETCPGSQAHIYLEFPDQIGGKSFDLSVSVSGSGGIYAQLDIPAGATPGEYTFAAECVDPPPYSPPFARQDLEVTPAPPPSTTTTRTTSPTPAPPTRPTTGGATRPTVIPTEIRPTFTPGGTVVPPPPSSTPWVPQPHVDGPDPSGLLALLAVVAALVGGTVLARKLLRGRSGEAPEPEPVIHASARPPEHGTTRLVTGPGRTPAVRVLARSEPGEPRVRRSGGEWSE